jgi:mycothiol synthase
MEIRPFHPDDYAALAEIGAAIETERDRTADWFRQRDATWNPTFSRVRLVAVRDGAVAGWGDIGHTWWSFHPRKFLLRLNVHPAEQGRGVGSVLYSRLCEHAESRWDPRRIGAETRENRPHSRSFLEHRGFQMEHRRWESRLDVADARVGRRDDAEARLARYAIAISTVADERKRRGEGFVRDLFELEQRASRDEPAYDPDGAMQFDQFVANELDPATLIEDGSFLAVHEGKLVGVSRLLRDVATPQRLHVGFTGVDPGYRGQGIAVALKLRTVEYARRHGFEEIRTQNDATNAAMLHINEVLGFKREPAWLSYAKYFPS